MKILQLHNYYQNAGGEDEVFAAECQLLQERGHSVIRYTESNCRVDKMHRFAAARQAIWSHRTYRTLLRLLKDKRPDVAHFHNTFLLISPSAYYACRKAKVPVVQTLHNYRLICPAAIFFRAENICEDCLDKTPPWKGIVYACYRNARLQTAAVVAMLTIHRWLRTWQNQVDQYIALTKFEQKKLIAGGIPPEKIIVKPNFICGSPELPQEEKEYILFVGRLSLEKGIRTLVRAWHFLQKIPLKIIGDGPLKEELEGLVKIMNIQNVEFLGHRSHDEVMQFMKKAYCLVLPSEWYECFSMTIIEAFSCGIPVVASRLGAMCEIIEEGRTGLFFQPKDINELIAKVEWAWEHPDKIKEMGREARLEFEAKYTADTNYKLLIDIYNKVIEINKSRG